jgi:hypothetical protein
MTPDVVRIFYRCLPTARSASFIGLAFLTLAYIFASLVAGVFLAELALHPGRRILDPRHENTGRENRGWLECKS